MDHIDHKSSRDRTPVLRKFISVMSTLVALCVFSACAVGQGSAVEISDNDSVKIGVIPAIAFAPVYIAIEQGYFEDENINVETQEMQNAAAIAPAVINGQLQFGTAATSPIVAAQVEGLPLVAVAGMSENSETSNDGAIVVDENSTIDSPRDLEGATVAINGVATLPHVALQEAISKDGGDPTKTDFVVMGFPEMPGALAEGRVDAAALTEPFTSAALGNGGKILTRAYFDAFMDNAPISMLFTATPFVENNPEVVNGVQRAIDRAVEDALHDPELVAEVMTKHGGIDPDAFDTMVLPPYQAQIHAEGLTQISEVMVQYGYISEPLDGHGMVLP